MKNSTLVILVITVGWLLAVLAYYFGLFGEGGSNKYGLALAFVFLGPVVIVWNWFYMRNSEKEDEKRGSNV